MTAHAGSVHAEGPLHAGERRTRVVVLLSVVTMAVELVAGWSTGSMALVADGWHMGTHVAAHLERDGDVRVEDIRVWPLGGGVHGCTVRVSAGRGCCSSAIREQIEAVHPFGHLAVEVYEARE